MPWAAARGTAVNGTNNRAEIGGYVKGSLGDARYEV
jgi:hypothetical protein